MTLAITPENTNSLSVTNDSKLDNSTWADMTITWDDAAGTWATPGTPFTPESKNNLSITNENKN